MQHGQTGTLSLRTTDIAEASGYSAQQVRNLEALGVIAAAERTENGYRRFRPVHIRDLAAYRELSHAVGPVEARAVMQQIRWLPTDQATARLCQLHTRLNAQREEALAAAEALRAIHREASTDAVPIAADAMTITELSGALGVRASTLRFWEQAGLVTPDRVATRSGTARRYRLAAIREARIVTALRAAGYGISEVHKAMTALRELQDVADSLQALDTRLEAITRRGLALLRAGETLARIVAGVE